MSDSRDYKLDITGLSDPQAKADPAQPRPFLSVMFACCSVYQRVYRDPKATEYVGQCPRCLRTIRFKVSPGGTTDRTFIVQ